jgi:serine/threonine-protein kinase HipA
VVRGEGVKFQLSTCNLFWGEERHRVTPYEKLRLLAVTGGVPRYLEELNPALSADANIQRMCFSPEGLLFNEFDNIFTDLFSSRNEAYRRLVTAQVDGPLDLEGLYRALGIAKTERRQAEREGRAVRTLTESDYLLGVSDETRLGALRFRWVGEQTFQAPSRAGVPSLIELGRLMQITERILRDEETDEDLQLIFAPGSSLGGARPKASVIDQHGHLSIAKFPKETDEYSMETWEEIALRLAEQAGITTPHHGLLQVAGKAILLSRRFDRSGLIRIPFLSAMSMTGSKDGERGSYPEIVDALTSHGAQAKADAQALYRRVVFNVLISNVDDHLRNHGFLWLGKTGWTLSPAYDLNPVPTDLKARVLTTNIDIDEGTCSLDLLEEAAEYFSFGLAQARTVIKEVATVTATWRDVAKNASAKSSEINRMASAFEHDDLKRALAL